MNYNHHNKLKKYHTFSLNVIARAVYSIYSVNELIMLCKNARLNKCSVLLLGEGSNVIFVNNFDGLVILNRITSLNITESSIEWYIHVGSGNNWHKLVKKLIKNGIYGLENMAFIPGSVGAAPIQNIGAYGMEFKDVCNYVDIINLINGKQYRLNSHECEFGYRDSVFKHKYRENFAIVSVGLKLKKLWKPILTYSNLTSLIFTHTKITAKTIFNFICKIRKSKLPDPYLVGNAGSFFKNPVISSKYASKINLLYPLCPKYPQINGDVKLSAGWLIEQCNLKGYQYGGAAIHNNHALVLINKNNATGKDVINLARYIKKKVIEKFDIKLEPEVRFIGKYGEINAKDAIS
ncbi:UDP-N-acetylenolpyruvoylglucosamine reductase [Candidatus Arsenophonus lipoptenae]|uniref:UDP-N-acetylenolpyruvoylglucosamine reductase n=1 Tax=Candidatus Arsenophonus lipoptenae TaxID=634113 RepID=A0A109QE82_9GAMM|nr:UDP-N-acetylmuramate dehydrogenase [Candidatus Arsenophonus lipoptenae]AMA64936.1 UDP-N-acetylenolpyruvoylglucosamine reductase [Candidatus Arsenophonus lipoptenae]